MTKPLHQLYLLLPLVFITWWTLIFGFNTNTKSVSASVTIGTAGVAGASIGGGISKDRSKSSTYNNSTLSANTINLNSTKDTNIKGANIHGTSSTTLNVGADLNVASLQDRHTQKSLGVNVSAGFSSDDNIDQKTGKVTKKGVR